MAAAQYVRRLLDDLTWQNKWVSEQEHARVAAEATLAIAEDQRASTLETLAKIRQLAVDGKSEPLTVRDVADCKTQREVLREIAIHNAGIAELTEAAALVKEAKMTSTTKDGARSNLHHFVAESEDWTFIGSGKVWLLEFGPVPDGLADLKVDAETVDPEADDDRSAPAQPEAAAA